MIDTSRRATCLLAVLCLAGAAASAAGERGTREEARALVDRAWTHVGSAGLPAACKDFTVDRASWTRKDLYVMVYDARNVGLAHGANAGVVGRDMSALKDLAGKPLVATLNAVAAHGGGWVDYDWPDPVTHTVMHKSTYARALPGGGGFIGVGIYR